jgi:poly-gamma-glutamate synthesis protein (capsule biosynthesis protein)
MEVLSAAGVDAANLANNHTFDFGKAAFLDTIENVRKAGVTPVGWGPNREQALTPAVFDLEGAKVAFLSFTHRVVLPPEYYGLWEAGTDKPGTIYWTSEQDMLTAVSRARESADIVVAVMHWNYEYEHTPRPDQVALAHRLVDSGAQLVVGHHPHLPYGVEVYNGVPIIYSLGNFIFHPYDLEARDSVVAEIRVKGDRLNSLDLVPIRDTDGQADLLAGEQADPVLAQVQDLCNRLGTNAIRDGDRLRIEIPH